MEALEMVSLVVLVVVEVCLDQVELETDKQEHQLQFPLKEMAAEVHQAQHLMKQVAVVVVLLLLAAMVLMDKEVQAAMVLHILLMLHHFQHLIPCHLVGNQL